MKRIPATHSKREVWLSVRFSGPSNADYLCIFVTFDRLAKCWRSYYLFGNSGVRWQRITAPITGESISLENFMLHSELLSFEDQLCEAKTNVKRIDVVEKFLIGRMASAEPDKLILAALALIHKSKGNIRITELTEQLHISQSPLEKRFRQAVGTSPKKFASIVRLKNILQQYTPTSSLTELGNEAGFYDQAHFIKEFKNFTGDTPEKFFNSKA